MTDRDEPASVSGGAPRGIEGAAFAGEFESLTGFPPMNWQRRLFFERFLNNNLPLAIDVPTGLGKTSIMVLWLLGLVHQARTGRICLPRRLLYVVNRRTVVDQATATAERMRERLISPEGIEWQRYVSPLRVIGESLRSACASGDSPLAISTLRGELADNEEWKSDPARPAIVVGTIDMVGSKLLFSGYGDRRYARAHHAGLVGQDALIVHDEAHLTPAFGNLLRAVHAEQQREGTRQPKHSGRLIQVMELSATSRATGEDCFALDKEKGDEDEKIVIERLGAEKWLKIHEVEETELVRKLVEVAARHDKAGEVAKVVVYVTNPERALQVDHLLRKSLGESADQRIALLTGTMRGYERDALVRANGVYRAMLDPNQSLQRTVYLISTSAGEVGIDLDADHMVCDLTTLDSLIQRLGRVNRRGGKGREASIDLIAHNGEDATSEIGRARKVTLALLRKWGADSERGMNACPRALRGSVAAESNAALEEAFSPKPESVEPTDVLLDAWSLTSVQDLAGRPEVAPFLHGLTCDPPETYVAWRAEIAHLEGQTEQALRAWFDACPISTKETLRDRTDRVKKRLRGLSDAYDREESPRVVVLDERGNAWWSRLREVAESDSLAYRTVVLPVEARGLSQHGMLDPKAPEPAVDVAEEVTKDDARERWLRRVTEDAERLERIGTGEIGSPSPALREKLRLALRATDEDNSRSDRLDLVLRVSPKRSALENPESTSARQTLREHTEAIERHMAAIASALQLPEEYCAALITAARWHDKGKDRPVWQRYARNLEGNEALAKAETYLHPRALAGYRHEFGSVLDAMAAPQLEAWPERDLVLHLIAAHHGWARPHFEPRSYDGTCTSAANEEAAQEVTRRFGRLQQLYGRWGLAWLESLVRCADIAASREAAESVNEAERVRAR